MEPVSCPFLCVGHAIDRRQAGVASAIFQDRAAAFAPRRHYTKGIRLGRAVQLEATSGLIGRRIRAAKTRLLLAAGHGHAVCQFGHP